MGDHTEVVSIDYDPKVLNYTDLLDIFWAAHRCNQVNRSRQYMNAIFYHDDVQKAAAIKASKAAAARQGVDSSKVETEIVPVRNFTYAEAYHQKYYLTRFSDVRGALSKVYPTGRELADSTVATRLNAYLGSGMKKDWKVFLKELPEFGLPVEVEQSLTKAAAEMVPGSN